MASIVQELLKASNGTFITSVTASGSKTVTAGNAIYVLVGTPEPANVMAVTDNLSNTYTEVFELKSGVLNNTEQHLFATVVANAGTLTSIVASWTGVVTTASLCSFEADGALAVGGTPVINGTGGNTTVSVNTGGGVTGFLLAGLCVWNDWGSIGSGPSGYTLAASQAGGANAPSVALYAKDGTTIGSISATWTNSREATLSHLDMGLAVTPPALTAAYSFDGVTVR